MRSGLSELLALLDGLGLGKELLLVPVPLVDLLVAQVHFVHQFLDDLFGEFLVLLESFLENFNAAESFALALLVHMDGRHLALLLLSEPVDYVVHVQQVEILRVLFFRERKRGVD